MAERRHLSAYHDHLAISHALCQEAAVESEHLPQLIASQRDAYACQLVSTGITVHLGSRRKFLTLAEWP